MRWINGLAVLLLCFIVRVRCQQNAIKNLSPSLLECYDGDTYDKWKLLPHNIETFLSIIRKIESHPGLNMDLRVLSTALLHRFRQDGIVKNPQVKVQAGVMPYAPLGKQFFRHAQTLRVIPGSAVNFPNDSISALERCTLHSMLSSSIDLFERGDESRVCKLANYAFRRYGRSADETDEKSLKEEVETLSPEQLEMMTRNDAIVDPNSLYPALPPNHPSSARLMDLPPFSRCPTENGIIKTPWGTVAGGSVLAGIAASLEPQMIRIGDLIRQQVEQRVLSYPSDANLDNKFIATLAGDLAEVALLQGPQQNQRYSLGADGNWNSTNQPLYYFLNSNENLEMTAAEIRGDLDGLILASQVPEFYRQFGSLRLSQIIDMYYSNRGFFDRKYRACNRRALLPLVAPTETLISQTHNAALVLSSGIARATVLSEAIEKFAIQAVKDLSTFIPTMNSDASCEVGPGRSLNDNLDNQPAVDLTIILDTNWPYEVFKSMIGQLLSWSGIDVSKFNSNFTLMSCYDGSIMISSSSDISDFNKFNLTHYNNYTKGFDLPKAIEKLRILQTEKLNRERQIGSGGGKSDIVLVIPYEGNVQQSDKDYINYDLLRPMRLEVPDAVLFFLSKTGKGRWTDFVPDQDIFSITIGETADSYPAIDTLVQRIKQVPRRFINSHCGANYETSGYSQALTDYVASNGINFYRMHPNYFFTDNTDNPPTLKIRSTAGRPVTVCTSRTLLHINTTAGTADECTPVTGNEHIVRMNCDGASLIQDCRPYYVSISSNYSTPTFSCTDANACRWPDDVKVTISYENLVCKSGASTLFITPLFLIVLLFARFF